MSYFNNVDTWLEKDLRIADGEARRAIKDRILQSYRNGQKECLNRITALLKDLLKEVIRQVTMPSGKQKKYNKPRR